MLAFFRRLINSRVGVVVTFVVLGVIALAFAAGDVTGIGAGANGILGSKAIAKVGGTDIDSAELRGRAENEVEAYRRDRPTLTLAEYVAGGGLDATLERMVGALALGRFAHDQGMVVSKRAVDGQLASIPGLQGINGRFDPALYQRILAERRLTDAQVRGDIMRDTLSQQLTLPTLGASQVPRLVALPYASLLLERRTGQVGFIPTAALAGAAAPGDADLQTFYRRNIARYSLPERRVARYAIVTPGDVAARAIPTAAEIAAAYKAAGARFQPRETRTISQVVVADQAGAQALAAKVRGGTPIAAAAAAAGLEAATQADVDKAAYARVATPAVADAAFAAAGGSVVGPLRAALGWTVLRVVAVKQLPGKTLAAATPELVAELTKQKTQRALADRRDAIDDTIGKGATFDEVIADQTLRAQQTPALVANGTDPANPASRPDPALTPVVTAAFQAEDGDDAQIVPIGTDGGFAVTALGQVQPAAPRPLAAIRAQVTADYARDRARQAGRTIAARVVASANRGVPLARALAETRLPLPPVEQVAASRAEVTRNRQGPPPALALMFSVPSGTTRLLESPARDGWLVVHVDRVIPGDAAGNAALIRATQGDLARLNGQEYVHQFVAAVRKQVGTSINRNALGELKRTIASGGGSTSDN